MNRYRSTESSTQLPLLANALPTVNRRFGCQFMAWRKTCIHFDAANMRVCCTCIHTYTQTEHIYISVARSSGTRIKKLDLTRLNELKYAKGSQAAVLRLLLLLAIESESRRCAAGFAHRTHTHTQFGVQVKRVQWVKPDGALVASLKKQQQQQKCS